MRPNIIQSSFPSRYKGAENQQMVDFSSSQSIFLIFLTSIVLAITSYFSAAPLMKLIGTGPDILDDAVIYCGMK